MSQLGFIPLALLSAFFAALVAIFGKIGLSNIDSTAATWVRVLVMAAFMTAVVFISGSWQSSLHLGSKGLTFIIFSAIAGSLSWIFYFAALKIGPATPVASLDRLSVVFVLILSALFLGESLTAKSVIAVGLIAGGTVLLLL